MAEGDVLVRREALALSSPLASPENPTQRRLAEIWSAVLGLTAIGIDDDYYELGGDSLRGIEIFLQIEQAFATKLPLSALVERPTIRRIAALITDRQEGLGARSLVVLRGQGSGRPLFCVHDSSGNVLVYHRLAQLLGAEQPVYGLQYPDQDQTPLPQLTIAELAAHHVAAIRRIDPLGPYCLGGYSVGGVIAFEIAQQLQADGREIALLAMVDSWAPGHPGRGLQKARDHLSDLCRRPPWTWPRYLRGRALHWLDRRRERALIRAAGDGAAIAMLEDVILPRAKEAYVPRPYRGRIQLFRCAEDRLLWRNAPRLGWQAVAEGGIDIHDLPATHHKVMGEPAVLALAGRLTTLLPTPSIAE